MNADFIFGQMRTCVQKPIDSEIHVIKTINELSTHDEHNRQLRAAFFTSKLWPKDDTINFAFIEEPKNVPWTPIEKLQRDKDGKTIQMDPIENEIRKMNPKEAVKYVISKRIQPLVGLKLVFVDDINLSNVRIGFNPDEGAYSQVGTDCNSSDSRGKKTLNLGWMDARTICHEILHVLGMIHEHQNPRGKTIEWNDNVIYEWANKTQGWDKPTTFHNIIEKYKLTEINGSNYDPESIMLYYFPATFTKNGVSTEANGKISNTDKEWIRKMYPGGKPDNILTSLFGGGNYIGSDSSTKMVVGIAIGSVLLLIFLRYLYKKYYR